MPFSVLLTDDANRDLEEIYAYIASHDDPRKAGAWLASVERVLDRLGVSANRGTHPKELLAIGIREYRQVNFKPYRIIYRVIGKKVYIYLVSDGRRDMRSLLERRLLHGE